MGILHTMWLPLGFVLKLIEQLLFVMITLYDRYCYSPLQSVLTPFVTKVPRSVDIGGRKVTVFSANIVSWSRTILVVPIAYCLKYNYPVTAFVCVLFHDFLDHLDGIVAKAQKSMFGQIDDPLLGGFMDAFCDKIVNCLSLWSILLVTDFSHMATNQTWILVGACAVIIAYEFVLGVVRVQDYFQAYYSRHYGDTSAESVPNIAAVMEGKLKEKLESLGIGCLCLAQASAVPMQSTSGILGVVCLLLSVRLAHASLQHKMKARSTKTATETKVNIEKPKDKNESATAQSVGIQVDTLTKTMAFMRRESIYEDDLSDIDEEAEKSDSSLKEDDEEDVKRQIMLKRSISVPSLKPVQKVDKVFTIGCFDLFHEGHVKLLQRVRDLGVQVIVGVHDSRSIFKLKKRVPIDDTCKRMANVKKYADVVFCVHGTDPTPYLQCMVDTAEKVTSMYVRGDDMPNFPARDFTEKIMPVHFLPYTPTVSSTKIRKEVYNASKYGPHVQHDDHTMFY